MAINTYATLKTAVANWLSRSDLTDYIPDFVAFAEARVNREMRLRAMETALDSSIASGVIAVPADYLELKHAYINASPVQYLQRKEPEWMYQKYPTRSADGLPKYIAQEGGNFIFGPYPDAAYQVKGIYFAKFDAMSADADTNWLLTNQPQVYLFAALAESAPFIGDDERITLWEQKYQAEKQLVLDADRRERYSGSTLSMTAS